MALWVPRPGCTPPGCTSKPRRRYISMPRSRSGTQIMTWSIRVSMMASGQAEALAADVGTEAVALGDGVLPRLVLRPAVALGIAPAVGQPLALARRGVARLAPPVVVVDERLEPAVVVTVGVHGERRWQAQADPAGLRRVAETHAGYREDARRQRQQVAQLLHVVAHHAD